MECRSLRQTFKQQLDRCTDEKNNDFMVWCLNAKNEEEFEQLFREQKARTEFIFKSRLDGKTIGNIKI